MKWKELFLKKMNKKDGFDDIKRDNKISKTHIAIRFGNIFKESINWWRWSKDNDITNDKEK